MKIFYSDRRLAASLEGSFVFIDTNSIITTINYPETFGKLLQKLKENECPLLTIPSVHFEFIRGSPTIDAFNQRAEFIESLVDTYPIEKHLEQMEDLIIVLQRVKGNIHYTDFLLYACLYKFPSAFLITENHKDFSLEILDRIFTVTLDTDKNIRNHGIYSFSSEKFNKAAAKILKNRPIEEKIEDIPF